MAVARTHPHSVVFINPPGPAKLYRSSTCTYVSKANYIWQPQDFISLSALVPAEDTLAFYDCSLQGWNEAEFFSRFGGSAPDVAIIALSSIVYDQDISFVKNFRDRFPSTRVLALGDLFLERVFHEKGLALADGLVLNPMDCGLADYIRTGASNSPNLLTKASPPGALAGETKSAPRKVRIGIPRHELFLNRHYRFPFARAFLYSTVSTQYGCPFQCQYCTQCKIPVTYRDHQEVLRELELVSSLGVREIFFGDPSFGFPRENAQLLLEGMIEKDLRLGWSCYANPGLIDLAFLQLMKRAGCHTVIIGVEDEDMAMLQAQYMRNLSKPRLLEFSDHCRQLRVRVCGDFIIGLNSDEQAVHRMIAFARRLRLDYASFNIFIPLLGSRVRERLVKEGKLDPLAVGVDTSGTFGKSHGRALALRNMAIRRFYLRPSYLVRRLVMIRGWEEFLIHVQEMTAMLKGHLLRKDGPSAGPGAEGR